jgi:hypothetical protein
MMGLSRAVLLFAALGTFAASQALTVFVPGAPAFAVSAACAAVVIVAAARSIPLSVLRKTIRDMRLELTLVAATCLGVLGLSLRPDLRAEIGMVWMLIAVTSLFLLAMRIIRLVQDGIRKARGA